jgi:hypothetical protein
VAEFAARLKDAIDLDAVQADLTSAVQQTLVRWPRTFTGLITPL